MEPDMEHDLKECRNKRCSRKGVLVYVPNRNYCAACGAKLKHSWIVADDTIPLVDLSPDDPPAKGKRGGTQPNNRGGLFVTGENSKCRVCDCLPKQCTHDGCSGCGGKTTNGPGPDNPGLVVVGGPRETGLTNGILTFQQFAGNWEKYQLYRSAFINGEKWALEEKAIGTVQSQPKGSDTFTCESAYVTGCPVKKHKEYLVEMPYDMFYKWVWLAMVFKTEWIAYLKGTQDEDGTVHITDMYFPKQKANGAHVDAADGTILEGTIGSVHSHVAMSAFFSNEDERHFNHPVEIVINRKGEFAASVRLALDCGRQTRVKSSLLFHGDPNMEALKTELQSKLTEENYSSKGLTHYYHGD